MFPIIPKKYYKIKLKIIVSCIGNGINLIEEIRSQLTISTNADERVFTRIDSALKKKMLFSPHNAL